MDWLRFLQTAWPIVVTLVSLASFAILLWLKTQFPTKADLKATEKDILAKIGAHQSRLDEGSKQLANLDRRVAVVEKDCESQPTKDELNRGHAVLAGRVSGVESALRGLERQVGTGNDMLNILVEQGLRK